MSNFHLLNEITVRTIKHCFPEYDKQINVRKSERVKMEKGVIRKGGSE